MTNLEKENEKLKKKIEILENDNSRLESELESYKEPIPIDMVFDVLQEKDAINLVSRLQSRLYGRITRRIESLHNETGLLENQLEIFELNAKNTSLGRIFKQK